MTARPLDAPTARPALVPARSPFAGVTPRVLVVTLAAFLVINFARTHEMFPILFPFQLGKLIGFPLLVLALTILPRGSLRAALRTKPGRGMLAIGALMVLSVPLSIWPGRSVSFLRTDAVISYLMFTCAATVLVDRSTVRRVLPAVVAAVAVNATRMMLPGAPVRFDDAGMARLQFGYSYDPNDTAVLFVATFPLALFLGGQSAGLRRWLWYAASLVMVVAIVRTGSRGGLLGLAVMLLTLVALAPPQQRTRLAGAGVLAAVVTAGIIQGNPALRERVASAFSSEESGAQDYNYTSANGRVELWKRGLRYMITHPITGVGVANYQTAEFSIGSTIKAQQGIIDRHSTTAHNSVIQIGAELGVFGMFSYLFVITTALAGLSRVRRAGLRVAALGHPAGARESALASAVLTAVTGVFAGGLFLSLAYSSMTVFPIALAVGIIGGAPAVLALRADPAAFRAEPARGRPAPALPRGRRGGLARFQARHYASSVRN